MTNTMIILMESVKLMENGILASTGTVQTIDGKQVEIPESIHTYKAWKSLGYVVKHGEHAIAKFPIWKYTTKRVKDTDTDEEKQTGKCYMFNASFFKASQVERMKDGK